jgi:hypothetical protein
VSPEVPHPELDTVYRLHKIVGSTKRITTVLLFDDRHQYTTGVAASAVSPLNEIKNAGAERAAVTVESLIAECDEALALAREMRNPTAMVAAIREKGVLSGKRVERSERGAPGEFDWIENASAEELQAFIADKLGIADISAAKH